MMNAPNWPGGESGLMSGTSPTHFSPFHTMPGRDGSQGLPSASAEARLYMMRRLGRQGDAPSGDTPRPGGAALFARVGVFAVAAKIAGWGQLPHPGPPACTIRGEIVRCS